VDISKANCYFISKLRSNTKLLETHEDQDFSLIDKLKNLDKKECKNFDMECRLGSEIKLPVRIVGKKMSEDQIEIRRKKMIKSRHKDCNVSENSAYLLSWNIYITNVLKQDLSEKDIADLYRLRWHIEMVFKNWKSNFKITELLAGSVGKCSVKVEMKMYLSLLYVIMIYQPTFNSFSKRIYKKSKKILSALKYGQYINDNLKSLIFNKHKNILADLIRYCCYENRKDRKNYYEYRYLL